MNSTDYHEERQRMRWDRMRELLSSEPTLAGKTVTDLAWSLRLPWFERWRDEPVRAYLDSSYECLTQRPGFGRYERERLFAILRKFLPQRHAAAAPVRSAGMAEAARQRLNAWQVPMDYPTDLLPLPVRLRWHAQRCKPPTLGAWITKLEELARKHQRNLGRKTLAESLELNDALAAGDATRVRRWVPIAPDARGLSFAVAMDQLLRDLLPAHRQLFEQRLVAGKTRAAVAAASALSPGRAQQILRDFLLRVQRFVAYFFPRGMNGPTPVRGSTADLSTLSKPDQALVLAAIAYVEKQPRKEPPVDCWWRHPANLPSMQRTPAQTLQRHERPPS